MKIAVDIQHKGQPSRPNDRGCFCNGRHETDYTERYGKRISELLTSLGHDVLTLVEGEYRERQELANELGAELYLACHVNAGGGKYSLCKVQPRASQLTFHLAERIAGSFAVALKTTGRAQVWRFATGENGERCIRNCGQMAILLEPFFIDDLPVALYAASDEGIEAIALAVTGAIWDILPKPRPRLSRTANG